ncbi:craniofacial development protein 2 [Biomphalaria pfeifferi]|uniref:Craniofacial development protein 2 n=1 Tax=Biomphalaria pfeifferi TaxID=112525 RepID=A0AAD8FJW5_BIOPF|nr:craniofacial development protein 2 [Biomphalaria pfeifferi]
MSTTLQDSNKSECPQRKSALVALKLARLDVEIAALSEVSLASQGSLIERELPTPPILVWKRPEEHRRLGV